MFLNHGEVDVTEGRVVLLRDEEGNEEIGMPMNRGEAEVLDGRVELQEDEVGHGVILFFDNSRKTQNGLTLAVNIDGEWEAVLPNLLAESMAAILKEYHDSEF